MTTVQKKYTRFAVCALMSIGAIIATRQLLCLPAFSQTKDAHDHEGHAHEKPVRKDAHDHADHAGEKHDEKKHGEKTGHEGHAHETSGHEEHDDENIIRLSKRDRRDIGIATKAAGPGTLSIHTRLLGKVRINEDHLAHVVPLVSGITTKVHKRAGDQVKRGEVLAVIASRELAELKASFLTARERRNLALSAFEREKQLWQKKISSEQEYLDARQALAEAEIEVLAAEQSLHALGISEEQLKQISKTHTANLLTRFEIKASVGGTIIAKHITRGEKVGEDADVFVIADLGTVWVDLNVSQKDLGSIKKHQRVAISATGVDIPGVTGRIGFVSPTIDEETRTAVARVVIPNSDGQWRPGLFVTALLTTKQLDAAVLVPNEAIQNLAGESVVFVPDEDGYKSLAISTGRSDRSHTEILTGLRAGQEVVVKGAFELKAKIVTSSLDAHAGHGH